MPSIETILKKNLSSVVVEKIVWNNNKIMIEIDRKQHVMVVHLIVSFFQKLLSVVS